ncbi:MAG TPA: hypothetical protein VFH19_04670 [Nitrososphaeraceae archaeon]|nr:hypothetical protein [Nitrososphaeraceae archaeon]
MSQSNLIRIIIKNYIEPSNCFDIIAKDGITTDQFAISRSDSLFVQVSLSIRQVHLQIPTILRSVSIAKNLDYYQNKICHEIPSIPDTEQIKLILQTLRVIIIALFLKLNKLMTEKKTNYSLLDDNHFLEWNKYSEQVLIATSTIFVGYQQGRTETKILDTIKGTLDYIGISMSMIDKEMSYLY